jgi:hypothetical protein
MKKLLLLLLLIPVLSISQKKNVLKERIIQKNDSINMFIYQIQELDIAVNKLLKENESFEGDITKLLQKVSDISLTNEQLTEEVTWLKIDNKFLLDSISMLHKNNPLLPYLYKLISDNRFLSSEFRRSSKLLNQREYSNLFSDLDSEYYFEMDVFMRGCGGGGDIEFIVKDNYLIVFNDYGGDWESSEVLDVACFNIDPISKILNPDDYFMFQINDETVQNYIEGFIYAFNKNICGDSYTLKVFTEKNNEIKEEFSEYLNFRWDKLVREYQDLIFYNEYNKMIARLIFVLDGKWKFERY